jgi:hypothetical protein
MCYFLRICHLEIMNPNLRQYLETALWSTTDNSTPSGGEPLDKNYSVDDIAPEAIEQASADWESFVKQAGSFLDDLDLTDVAHDFWLTRNRHGAGFWDGDYEEGIGKKLTDLAHTFGEVDLYIGDDGRLYFT